MIENLPDDYPAPPPSYDSSPTLVGMKLLLVAGVCCGESFRIALARTKNGEISAWEDLRICSQDTSPEHRQAFLRCATIIQPLNRDRIFETIGWLDQESEKVRKKALKKFKAAKAQARGEKLKRCRACGCKHDIRAHTQPDTTEPRFRAKLCEDYKKVLPHIRPEDDVWIQARTIKSLKKQYKTLHKALARRLFL